MKKTHYVSTMLAVYLLSVTSAVTSDGAIPIWEPTTITEPGKYVLTRDVRQLHSPDFGIITISGDEIELDLNGFTVEGSTYPVNVTGSGVTVINGTVIGGNERVINLVGDNFVIRKLTLVTGDDASLVVSGSNGIIEDLVVDGSPGGPGILVYGNGNSIRNCVVNDSNYGISVHGEGNQITHNTISGCGIGIDVHGSFNAFEGNLVTGGGTFGIRLLSNATGNVYRGNTARNNNGTDCTGTASGGDFCDEGTNNTSHGDNYMPDQM